MYSKIAIENVKKSFKDYSIYFLTLTLAVCIFYSFNSIGSQKALIEISSSGTDYASMITSMLSLVSVFVAMILGSLILYANNFLIKKRNKELGIYMILGMGKSKISKILILETIMVGTLSLINGLGLGLLASQGLSVLVSKLFEVEMSGYSFVISITAILKTILYFGIMFLLVMVFNTYIISKYKIIDLLTVGRKVEEIKFKSPTVYLITFILCVASLGIAYKFVLDVGLDTGNIKFKISIILGVIGTVLFFFSLIGFILYVVKKNKKIYFKGLNIFIIKQINSKVNTNFISMAVICLMLFMTIGVLSTGVSFKAASEAGLKDATPFDASAYNYIDSKDELVPIEESFNIRGYEFNKEDTVVYYNEYSTEDKVRDLIPLDNEVKEIDSKVTYLKISDYNKIRNMKGQNPIKLSNDEILITSNYSKLLPSIEKYMKNNRTLKINNKLYNIKNKEVIEENMQTYHTKNNIFTIIINDDFCENATISSSNVNINFAKENNKFESQKFGEFITSYRNEKLDYDEVGFVLGGTREEIYAESKGMSTTILFITIYLGIVFLISSMAVLALQQLSEATDSIDRYVALKKLGVNDASINKTIYTQTLVYFTVPIILALVHSIVGIKVANDFISIYSQPDIGTAALITSGIFIIVYLIYFYTTYTGYKNIVKNRLK